MTTRREKNKKIDKDKAFNKYVIWYNIYSILISKHNIQTFPKKTAFESGLIFLTENILLEFNTLRIQYI